jgi:hypothetical protein
LLASRRYLACSKAIKGFNQEEIMPVKNKRKVGLVKRLVTPQQAHKTLRFQYEVIKKDILQLRRDVATGYEILKGQIRREWNQKILVRSRANK